MSYRNYEKNGLFVLVLLNRENLKPNEIKQVEQHLVEIEFGSTFDQDKCIPGVGQGLKS